MNLPFYTYPGDENAMSDVESGVYGKHHTFGDGETVLDIGAHVGFFTEWVRNKIGGGRIVAFEAHPRNFDELKIRCSAMPNVSLINAVACDTSHAIMKLWNNSHNSGGHSIFKSNSDHYHYAIEVPTINVGHYCAGRLITPTFAKIDAEGAEFEIITTILAAQFRPSFAIECHDGTLLENCRSILDAKNYECITETNMLFAELTC